MLHLTKTEASQVITTTNGFDMTYADLLDNKNIEYEVLDECEHKTTTLHYTDDLIGEYGVCNSCGRRVISE